MGDFIMGDGAEGVGVSTAAPAREPRPPAKESLPRAAHPVGVSVYSFVTEWSEVLFASVTRNEDFLPRQRHFVSGLAAGAVK
jgi:hypothetical protein